MKGLDLLIESAARLPHVPLASSRAYSEAIPLLKKHVDDMVESSDSFREVTGGNSTGMIHDNHRNHAMFMSAVFSIGEYALLARTLPWVYSAYSGHGFSSDYFPLVVNSFMDAVRTEMDPDLSEEILSIYQWMLDNHSSILGLSGQTSDMTPPTSPQWMGRKTDFMEALLAGEHKTCLKIAGESVKGETDLMEFYLQVLQPVMYEIGTLWENNEISVAREHLASAIVTRVMGQMGADRIVPSSHGGRVVVSASGGEFHEIGAWMVSDYFESTGWMIRYLGANTPMEDLTDLLLDFRPDVLALSVTMSFNLVHARELILSIRGNPELKNTRILVGGRVFNQNRELWRTVGADGYAQDLNAIHGVLKGWDLHGTS